MNKASWGEQAFLAEQGRGEIHCQTYDATCFLMESRRREPVGLYGKTRFA